MTTGWIVNDHQTCIEGTRTLWHDLCDWLPGAKWMGGPSFAILPHRIENSQEPLPDYIVRNASYFRRLGTAKCPTIALLQDIMPEGSGERAHQLDVCRHAALTVFNSEYTRAQYPELADVPYRVIPLSVDFDLFRPMPEVEKRWDVCWIGARSNVKGWDILSNLIDTTPYSFCLVLKDYDQDLVMPPLWKAIQDGRDGRLVTHARVPHADLPAIINACRVGLCTSRQETQHLAGIEMGACGLPMVAPPVGVYWSRGNRAIGTYSHSGNIGHITTDHSVASLAGGIHRWLRTFRDPEYCGWSPRWYWERLGLTREACRAAWMEAVEAVTQ